MVHSQSDTVFVGQGVRSQGSLTAAEDDEEEKQIPRIRKDNELQEGNPIQKNDLSFKKLDQSQNF